jgi:hypothetical protein
MGDVFAWHIKERKGGRDYDPAGTPFGGIDLNAGLMDLKETGDTPAVIVPEADAKTPIGQIDGLIPHFLYMRSFDSSQLKS